MPFDKRKFQRLAEGVCRRDGDWPEKFPARGRKAWFPSNGYFRIKRLTAVSTTAPRVEIRCASGRADGDSMV